MTDLVPRRLLLIQVLITCGPPVLLLSSGRSSAAAIWYFGVLLAIVLCSAAGKRAAPGGALIVATIPLLMVIRDYFSYSSVFAVLAVGVAVYVFAMPQSVAELTRNRTAFGPLAALSLFWALSAITTGDVLTNIRALELALAVANVYLLGHSRRWLGASLNGLVLCTFLVSLGLLPFGERLGAAQIGEISLGNPARTGFLSALVLLLAFADRGRWLLLEAARRWIFVIVAAASCTLALSTSRGGWAVAVVMLCSIAVLDRRSRTHVMNSAVITLVAVVVVLQTARGTTVIRYFDKVMSSERSVLARTSGRSDQWRVFPTVVWDSPVWGHGFGAGRRTSYEYTGVGRDFHSLYLHVGTETGLLGLAILAYLMASIGRRCRDHRRMTSETLPLAALLGFATIGITVNGFDAISGVYVGLALLGGDLRSLYVVVPTPHQSAEALDSTAETVQSL
ncbi:MAG: O-antigen ligase family protein [Bryobacterales bacterium]|nr:O-antigen ligase family protein [Bryobacterales bacterium]